MPPEITFFNGLSWSREMAEACAGIGLGLAVGQGHAGGGMLGRPMVSCEIGTRTINAFGESGPLLRPENPIELAGAMLCVEKGETLAKD